MRIARVVLHNVKSYGASTAVDLAPGINAVCGENGAGKSTILEAIGFALFGYRPYKVDAFLREGEKSGNITVTVEDDDGCSFHVVRKLGSSSGQAVYDELEQRIAEGEADVRNWLLGFLGLETGTDLAKLFEDTVGPPQGTLTAIFLESAAPRGKKFDRLLGIEDYPAAAQALRPVGNLFRDQATEADRRAALLEGDVRRLPEREKRHLELIQGKAELAVGLDRLVRQQAELEEARGRLEKARQTVQRAEMELGVAESRAREAGRRREEQATELSRAEGAARLVDENRAGALAYQEATERLRGLDQRRKERDGLWQSAETAAGVAIGWEERAQAAEQRLADLEREDARAAELQLLAPEQEKREEAVRRAEDRVRARDEANRQLPAAQERLKVAEASLQDATRRLSEVEAAKPAAERLEALRERDRSLRDELAGLEKQGWALKQATDGLAEAEGRLRRLVQELAQIEGEAAKLRPLQPLAVLAPARQQEWETAYGEVQALQARYQEAERSRRQVEGGLCPFLHEPCRNLRPGVSLDAHFDGVIADTSGGLGEARARLSKAEPALAEARSAEKAISRLPDLDRRSQQLSDERSKLEQEIDRLKQLRSELSAAPQEQARVQDALRQLAAELARVEEARAVVAGEPGWRGQSEEAAQAKTREEGTLAEIRAVLGREADAAEALKAARDALAQLGNPRGEAAVILQRIARERPEAQRAMERARRESANARIAEKKAREALEPYAKLEEEIAAAAAQRDQNETAHRVFLANQGEAERLPQRRLSHQKAVSEAEQAARSLEETRQRLESLRAAYDETELVRLRLQMEDVGGRIASGRRELELLQQEETQLLQQLDDLKRARAEMEAAQREAAECRQMMESVEVVRRALDAAGPEIARAMLRRISTRATALYRDLLGQPTVSLEWADDYEIRCRVRAEEREFKQLSGGEQMSAALAVRLALLQTLSNLRVAFLDEPTAHMDATRRVNLATQIQNLRSFDQLVVISHDDSFDTLFGHVVRLAKRDGATVVER